MVDYYYTVHKYPMEDEHTVIRQGHSVEEYIDANIKAIDNIVKVVDDVYIAEKYNPLLAELMKHHYFIN